MRYEHIKKENKSCFYNDDFSGGISKKNQGINTIKDSENLIFKDNALKTRPAVCVCEGHTLTAPVAGKFPLCITNTEYFLGGKKYNVAYHSSKRGNDYNIIYTYLVSTGNDILELGRITVTKGTYDPEDIMFYPQSIVIYSGTKTKGCGIYAFVSYSTNKDRNVYGVFEASDVGGDSLWYEINEMERYVPTVLINGRGESYNTANEMFNLNYTEPSSPEKLNMITPYFKSYFTSDGVSSTFAMPYSSLDFKPFKCKIYMTETNVIDFIYNERGPCVAYYNDEKYTALFSTITGSITFFRGDDLFAVPRSDSSPVNNIMITAAKNNIVDVSKVLSCQDITLFNSRAYLYKSVAEPNGVYSCKISNPLYFPTNMQTLVGSDISEIKGGGYQNDKLVIFKEGETYKINTSTANEVDFVSPENKVRFVQDGLSNQTISTKVGCIDGNTVATSTGQLIWMGNDKKIYTLEATTYGSEKNVFSISENIDEDILKAYGDGGRVFAMVRDGYYYLFCNDYVFVCDCHITNMGFAARYGARNMKSISWFKWKLPHSEYHSGKACEEMVISAYKTGEEQNYFLHFEEENTDTIIDFSKEGNKVKEYEIPVEIVSPDYDLGTNAEKTIDRITLCMNAGPTDLEIITDKSRSIKHIHGIRDQVKITNIKTHGGGTKTIGIKLKSKGKFSLESVKAYFKAVI